MMKNIIIREIETGDFLFLIELFTEFAHFEKLTEKMVNSVDRMQNEQEWLNGYVATDDKGKIYGYATWFFAYYTWYGKSMYMDDLYVRPELRGNGIGTKLINSVIDKAKETKCRKLRWQVSGWNEPAIEFYKKLGASVDPVESNCDLILN